MEEKEGKLKAKGRNGKEKEMFLGIKRNIIHPFIIYV